MKSHVLLLVLLACSVANAGWLEGWSHRKPIVIDPCATVDDFPVPIYLAADTDVDDVCNEDGSDIRFTAADGTTVLDAAVEAWWHGYVYGMFWVRVPEMVESTHQTIYMYYGNSEASAAWTTDVYDANFVAVWNMTNAADPDYDTLYDATANGHTGTKDSDYNPEEVTAQFWRGQSFDGATNKVLVADANDLDGMGAITISAWVKQDSTQSSTAGRIVDKGFGSSYVLYIGDTGRVGLNVVTDAGQVDFITDANDTVTQDDWTHVTAQWRSSDDTSEIWFDGVSVTTYARTGTAVAATDSDVYLGNRAAGDRGFKGVLDEVRLSNSERSEAWILMEATPTASYVAIGAEQAALDPATDPDPAHEATDVGKDITLSWSEVTDANDYNVYFGRVGYALKLVGNVDVNSIAAPPIGGGIEYQWRVDPNDPNLGATTGDVWTFTAEPNQTLYLTGATGVTAVTPKFTFSSGTVAVYVEGEFVVNLTSGVEATGGSAIALSPGESLEYRCSDWQAVTQIDINNDKCAGNLAGFQIPDGMTYLNLSFNSFSGDLSGWTIPSGMQYLSLYANSFSGDLSGWTLPSGMTTLYLDRNSFEGDLSGWTLPSGMQYLYLYDNSFTGDLSGWTIPSSMNYLSLYSNSFSYGSGGAFAGVTSSLVKLDFDDCGLGYLEVNRALSDLVLSGVSGKELDIAGTNAGPSQTGEIDRATLAAASWTISINATVAQSPLQATYVSPADGATNVALSTPLVWGTAYDASDYNVYLNNVLVANTETTQFSPTLSYDTFYEWRIDPNHADGGATTGDVWSFTTVADPTAPEEPEEPDIAEGWRKNHPGWIEGPPVWQKREIGSEAWRKR
jgi:hypothetical protein